VSGRNRSKPAGSISEARVYQYFCELLKPADIPEEKWHPERLNLKTEIEFNAVVGPYFIKPMRDAFMANKMQPVMSAWHAEIERRTRRRDDTSARRG
jgi:hypothetical protein